LNWDVDTRTVRRQVGGVDQPAQHVATIKIDKPLEEDPATQATMAEFRQLLTRAVNQLGIPDDAKILEGVTLVIQWG
jgi:hypothetical protein